MQATRLVLILACVLTLAAPLQVIAKNGSYTGSGGVFTNGSSGGPPISVQGLPLTGTGATASFTCLITTVAGGTSTCSGGSVAITSPDNSLVLNGTFSTGSMSLSASGGGRGGHVSYTYQFYGAFNGKMTAGLVTEGAIGSISATVRTTKPVGASGAPVNAFSLGWNSAYSPVVVGDSINGRLLETDNLTGANLASYGSHGNGTGQFESIAGLAHDASGRIYVTDSSLNRLVRIDSLTGKNRVESGSFGVGTMHFNRPQGVAIDSAGKIWVADAGNNRIVRFDDMSGKNWTSFGSLGTGAKLFSAPSAIAFDSLGRIYVADSGNNRLVRFDDLTGKNWTSLTTINLPPYAYPLNSVNAVVVLTNGKFYAATSAGWLFRMDDMTGANAEVSLWSPSIATISLDKAGTLYIAGGFVPGLAQTLDAYGTGSFTGTLGLASLRPSAVLALASTSPTPAAPVLSTSALSFGSRNVGEPGSAQTVTVTNLGAGPLTFTSISASADFLLSNGCAAPLTGGSQCSVSVRFDPTATGVRGANLLIETNGAHPALEVALGGTGTAPHAVVLPGSLAFQTQKIATANGAQTVTLTNTGSGPLTIASIAASGDFSETNNCPTVVSSGNGCTIQAIFKPTTTGARTGSLTIKDDALPAGTQQVVAMSGAGATTTPNLIMNPESLTFPTQQVGVTSAAQTVTLQNASNLTYALGAPVFPAGFKGSTTCGTSLAPGASCAVNVEFSPTAAGPAAGKVAVPITGHSPQVAGVAGTGVQSSQPALAINPGAIDFGLQQVADTISQNVTLTNLKGLPVGIRSIGLSGSTAFTNTGNNCPAILAGNASCVFQITFSPAAVTSYAGTLTITESSGAKSPVPLSGSASINGN